MKYSAGILPFPNSTVFAQKGRKMAKLFNVFIALAILVLAGCASPQTSEEASASGSTDTAQASSSGDDPNEMICRREEVTGTNFRRRVCLTRAERMREQQDSQEEMLERRSSVR
jgi:outer membrane murein-binding lipoprotein Lpp